jgi:lipopolysaccharide/colanic/teichoic acid biosynthesis glycosyltransferase
MEQSEGTSLAPISPILPHPGCQTSELALEESLAGKTVQLALKRAMDVCAASIVLVTLAPLLVLISLLILVESGRPVLFQQRRAGLRGREFGMLKFRSMKTHIDPNQEAEQRAMAARGVLVKKKLDPRVTAVGYFLRLSSLDETPQLFNVLKGEMSLVGPRPLLPFMLAPQPEFARARALMRPGITGLWQVRDRKNNTTADSMRPHDLEYLRQFSLALDIKILLKTVPAVLSAKGAC